MLNAPRAVEKTVKTAFHYLVYLVNTCQAHKKFATSS